MLRADSFSFKECVTRTVEMTVDQIMIKTNDNTNRLMVQVVNEPNWPHCSAAIIDMFGNVRILFPFWSGEP